MELKKSQNLESLARFTPVRQKYDPKPTLSEKELKRNEAEKAMLLKYMIIEGALMIPTGIALMYQAAPKFMDRAVEFLVYLR